MAPVTDNESVLRIAVVGHTNTGKTSLLRTLTRDVGFGQVSAQPSTTRHVEAARLLLRGKVALELFDTPGMEDSVALLEFLEQSGTNERLDGPARIAQFLETPQAKQRFEQEAKVVRQMLRSDAAFYVIDARDPVLAKHRDELTTLGSCGIPLLPLLNFVSDPAAKPDLWRQALARAGLHAVVSFDTVAPARDGERLLYEKLATLLDAYRSTLQSLIKAHEQDALQRHQAALGLLAELLVDVAACRVRVSSEPASRLQKAAVDLHKRVREREQLCVNTLLTLSSFLPNDLETEEIPIAKGRWEQDLFDPEILQTMGVRVGGGAAAGASIGFGIDLMVGGISLGAAALIGALAGGGLQTLRHYGQSIKGKLVGEQSLRVDDNILRVLVVRQLQLITALENRGHAAMKRMQYNTGEQQSIWSDGLPSPLRKARAYPEWSSLYGEASFDDTRSVAIDELSEILQQPGADVSR